MRSRLPNRSRVLAVVALVVLVAVGCANPGNPESFVDQPGRVGEELGEALGLDPEEQLPLVERNFLEGCIFGEAGPDVTLTTTERASTCRCMYAEIRSFLDERTETDDEAFEVFEQLDDDLQDPASPIGPDLQNALDGCLP